MTGGGADAVKLGKTVSDAWVSFARTGKPAAEGLPAWPVFTKAGRESMHLDTVSAVGPYMDSSMVEMFHRMLWAAAGL